MGLLHGAVGVGVAIVGIVVDEGVTVGSVGDGGVIVGAVVGGVIQLPLSL